MKRASNLWRYREYVINSFNQDKPYNQFVNEQMAGDEIAPGNPEALVATGFLGSFPDNSNSRDLVQQKFQITTDITDTVGKVFLGQTVGCARCHNHKFDNISRKSITRSSHSLRMFMQSTIFLHRKDRSRKTMKQNGKSGKRPARRSAQSKKRFSTLSGRREGSITMNGSPWPLKPRSTSLKANGRRKTAG